jgi:hypothetical protein
VRERIRCERALPSIRNLYKYSTAAFAAIAEKKAKSA